MKMLNPIIQWGINALRNNQFELPNDPNILLALKLAGYPEEELIQRVLPVGVHKLQSIFSIINNDSNKCIEYQHLDLNHLPTPKIFSDLKNEKRLEVLKLNEFKELFDKSNENEQTALALMEKLGCYLSISILKPHMTFFDTIKNAAAIYACIQNNGNSPAFRLIAGDLSGIQNYLFNMSESNSKGVAKILRARSFYLGLFCDVCRHYLLHSLELPLYCTIVDAGGRFVILAPDSVDHEIIENVQQEIDSFCVEHFYGELSLHLHSGDTIKQTDFSITGLVDHFEKLNAGIENKKNKTFQSVMSNQGWNTDKFILGQDYDNYINGLCEVSGKLPKKQADSLLSGEFEKHKQLGQELLRTTYLGFQTGDSIHTDGFHILFPFESKQYCIHFLQEKNVKARNEFYLTESLKSELTVDAVPRYFDGYVPRFKNIRGEGNRFYPFEKYPDFSIPIGEDKNNEPPNNGDIVDFETLSFAGVCPIPENGDEQRYIGIGLLGLIKADVDRMGQVIMNGLKDVFSLTAYTTLSRELNLFFTGYIPKIQEKDFPWIYTVYTGGDDLLFIGEWQESIKFAQSLYKTFRSFTGENPAITLSSAVHVMHHNQPIRTAAEIGEELLSKAKANNRDSFAVFDTVVNQAQLNELMIMSEFLDGKRKLPNSESNINSGFLHRLNQYMKMAKAYDDGEDPNGIMYKPRLSYDMGRNIVERDKKTGEITKGKEEYLKLHPLIENEIIKKMAYMQLPIYWAILKNRSIQ